MRVSQSIRRLKFSVSSLLILVAIAAALMVPFSYVVRARLAMPDFVESAVIELGSQNGSPAQSIAKPDPSSIYQRLLQDQEIGALAIRRSSDPAGWLRRRLSIENASDPNVVFIEATGQREHVEAAELQELKEATIEVIYEFAEETATPASLISTSSASLIR